MIHPFAVKKDNQTFEQYDNDGVALTNSPDVANVKFEDVAAINGLPYGIRENGEIIRLHQGRCRVTICFIDGYLSIQVNSV